ncbi:glycosyltransferase family 2 protein [Desulfovibrio sp. ZJ200]|uniref:glycosyltransferase family 2 protein n=1 Tax=Desulfovibrio sp. ZJ200 TaxID=2709792 RepID=UPI0013ECC581|nr:glycosyltransferase family 2 protein [Desulfovibrio sp. ZJ200]
MPSVPQVSVIIPVYNTGPYLRRCLDSVCRQTLRDIEIICVDGGSTDNSLEILRDWQSRDARIRLIELGTNQGSSVAAMLALLLLVENTLVLSILMIY